MSSGHNLDSGTGCGFHAAGDIAGVDPQFSSAAAQDNGGDTDTLGLMATSPAVDAVPPGAGGCGGTDQRGIARPQGTGCDIGAFELSQPNEGSAFTFQVAIAGCSVSGPITINWGDGTASLGAVRSGGRRTIGRDAHLCSGRHLLGKRELDATTARGEGRGRDAGFSVKVADAPLSAAGLAIAVRVEHAIQPGRWRPSRTRIRSRRRRTTR